MSIHNNTIELQAILAAVNALPEAGSGGTTSGYTPVYYIQFTGEQTIDTGIVPNQDTRIEITFTREASDAMYLYGVRSTNNTASITAYLNASGAWRFGSTYENITPAVRADYHNAVQDKSGVTLNGTAYSYKAAVGDFTAKTTLTIGSARTTDGSYGEPSYVGKISAVRIYNGDNLVFNGLPYKNAAGVYGLFDMISNTFKTSITSAALQGA